LAAIFMQQAQANPSARVASCLPTGSRQRRVDLGFFMDPNIMKTVHHIDPKPGDTLSFNCPVCGCAHMQQDKNCDHYWFCHNGHEFYVRLYQSSAKTLNLSFVPVHDISGDTHG